MENPGKPVEKSCEKCENPYGNTVESPLQTTRDRRQAGERRLFSSPETFGKSRVQTSSVTRIIHCGFSTALVGA